MMKQTIDNKDNTCCQQVLLYIYDLNWVYITHRLAGYYGILHLLHVGPCLNIHVWPCLNLGSSSLVQDDSEHAMAAILDYLEGEVKSSLLVF